MLDAILDVMLSQFPANFSELEITRYTTKMNPRDTSWFDMSYPGHWRYRPLYGPNRPKEHEEEGWRFREYNHKLIEEDQEKNSGGTI